MNLRGQIVGRAIWIALLLSLALATATTLDSVRFVAVGMDGPGAAFGVGQGAVALGATMTRASAGLRSGTEDLDYRAWLWPRIEDNILTLPVWIVACAILALWFALARRSRRRRDRGQSEA